MGRKSRICAPSKRHSRVRELVPFVEDLKQHPAVRTVGTLPFHEVPKTKIPQYKIVWYNKTNSTYKIRARAGELEQDFLVGVDPRMNVMIERFVSLYGR